MQDRQSQAFPSELINDLFATGNASGVFAAETMYKSAVRKTDGIDLNDPAQRKLGRYELLGKLGQGGMGTVYRARESGLNRDVALKVIGAGVWASQEFVERFRLEAQSAAKLHHPNIVPIFEIDQVNELLFFTMALIDGETLADRIERQGKLDEITAAKLLRPVVEAIDYAHRLQVLHLDIKPANILLTQQGEPQVADFGLARQLGAGKSLEIDSISGTPSYMAPEQANPKLGALSPASDVYALGGVLHFLLTGQPAIAGDSATHILQQLLHTPVPQLRTIDSKLSKDVNAICSMCMQKAPTRRYPNARALADDLTRLIERREVSARPLGMWGRMRQWARREWKVAAALAMALSALLAGVIATTHQANRAAALAETARAEASNAKAESARAVAAEKRAREQAANAKSTSSFLTNVFLAASPETNRGKEQTASQLLEAANKRAQSDEFADRPVLQAQILSTIANVYADQSRNIEALQLAEKAVQISSSIADVSRVDLANQRMVVAKAYSGLQRYEDVFRVADQALQDLNGVPDAGDLPLRILAGRSADEQNAGYIEQAQKSAQELLRRANVDPQKNARWIGNAQITIAQTLREQGLHDQAKDMMQKAMALVTPIYGADSPRLLWHRSEYALMISKSGNPTAALVEIESILKSLQATTGANSQETIYAHAMRGLIRYQLADYQGALADQQLVLKGADPTQEYNILSRRYLADTLAKLGRTQDALKEYCSALTALDSDALKARRNAKRFRVDVIAGANALSPSGCAK